MGRIRREVDDLKRFEEIIGILAREGFGYFLGKAGLKTHLPLNKRLQAEVEEVPPPTRLRKTFEELGPTFIKFGQILAQRPDLLPQEYVTELEKLEDAVPAFSSETAVEIVEEEVGPVDQVFQRFDREPIAAASIAQVHRAVLENGDEVAVKIRRPGIKEQMEKDLHILQFLAKQAEKHIDRLETVGAERAVNEFASWTRDELDLEKEGRNAQILGENLSDEERVKIPDVYTDLTTEKVLVMEYVDGVKCSDEEALQDIDVDAEEIARTAVRAGLKQTIRDGFFHADPHPSNFLISDRGEIIYLDFGMMGKLTISTRRNLGLLLLHAANEEVDAAVDVVKRMATVEDDADIEGLKQDIQESILKTRNTTLEEESISMALFEIALKAAGRGVHMPPSLIILAKSMVTMEGIGLTIYPEFRMEEEFEEITERLLWEMNSPKKLAKTFMIDLVHNRGLLARMPSRVHQAMNDERDPPSTTVNVDTGPDRNSLVATGLVLGAFILLVDALPADYMPYIAVLAILAAAVLLLK